MTVPPLDPSLAPLAFLVGTWRGGGRGEYPTMATFEFQEETRFWHAGAEFLYYHLRTWAPASGKHLHSELGFWRLHPDGRVDVTLAHPLGLTEIAEGALDGGELHLRSKTVERTTDGASQVTSLERTYWSSGDVLAYEVSMATDETPLALHIVARLTRAA